MKKLKFVYPPFGGILKDGVVFHMKNAILIENENKRMHIPFWKLILFDMFCIWQMGFVYFAGPSLSVDGRTPLPIADDNITLLILAAYVCSIAVMIAVPKWVTVLSVGSCAVAFLTAIGWFFPFSAETTALLVYVHCFCCCFIIGFETATIVYFFSEKSAVTHLLAVYPIGHICVALLQNDLIGIPFSVFRIITLVLVAAVLIFYVSMPKCTCPRFVGRSDGLVLPKRFFAGVFLLVFFGALMGVIGPAVAAQVQNGVSLFYVGCAVWSAAVFTVHKKTGKHPIHLIVFVIAAAAIGYLLFFASAYVPVLALPACFFMSAGMAVCSLVPLFGCLMTKTYPSRMIAPGIIGLAMVAVFVHALIVETFRDAPLFLNLTYLILIVVFALVYLLTEPHLLYALKRSFAGEESPEESSGDDAAVPSPEEAAQRQPELIGGLTKRETEVVHLIWIGYTNADISKLLFISEHTVKDHIKNIYRKMQVHNRLELIAVLNRAESVGSDEKQ